MRETPQILSSSDTQMEMYFVPAIDLLGARRLQFRPDIAGAACCGRFPFCMDHLNSSTPLRPCLIMSKAVSF